MFPPPLPAILLYFQTVQTNWWLAWNLAVFSHMVVSITLIFPLACNLVVFSHIAQLWVACLESCCILTHGQITGGFNNLNLPLLPAILSYFQTLPTHWWLQVLKFSPVVCVASNNAKYLVTSIIYMFPPLPAILLYFQTLQTNWWLAWNLAVFSHIVASITSIIPHCLQSCCIFKQCKLTGRLPGILLYIHTWWFQSL